MIISNNLFFGFLIWRMEIARFDAINDDNDFFAIFDVHKRTPLYRTCYYNALCLVFYSYLHAANNIIMCIFFDFFFFICFNFISMKVIESGNEWLSWYFLSVYLYL